MGTLEDLFEQGIKESLKKFGERPAYFLVGLEVESFIQNEWFMSANYTTNSTGFGSYNGITVIPSRYLQENEVKTVVSV